MHKQRESRTADCVPRDQATGIAATPTEAYHNKYSPGTTTTGPVNKGHASLPLTNSCAPVANVNDDPSGRPCSNGSSNREAIERSADHSPDLPPHPIKCEEGEAMIGEGACHPNGSTHAADLHAQGGSAPAPPIDTQYLGEIGNSADSRVDYTMPEFMKRIGYPAPPPVKGETDSTRDLPQEDRDPNLEEPSTCDITGDTGNNTHNPDKYQNAQFNQYGNWPFPAAEVDHTTALIYDKVRSAGVPNYKGAKVPLDSPLHPEAWEDEATGHQDDEWLIAGTRYGFPIQYTGGPCYEKQVDYNHPSADAYSAHVNEYFDKETTNQAMAGPYQRPPFTPWYRQSPMMTRPKSEPGKRRVIVDLSYPNGGVNDYIHPHTYNGMEVAHSLPTISDLLELVRWAGLENTTLAVIDISRAYRHFPTCPLDWPLLVLGHKGQYYFDRATPFGARLSSFIMQSAAEFIIRALQTRNIKALMYLDDLIIVAPAGEADSHYQQAIALLQRLGLEVAIHKLQPPARKVTWLGINVDLDDNSISIPAKKLAEIQQGLAHASRQESLARKDLQRVIGQINHLSKVVNPARLFMGRLLAALRGAGRRRIKVDRSVRADFAWFRRFLKDYNGKSIIPQLHTRRELWVDACLIGAGGTDGESCYSYVFPDPLRVTTSPTSRQLIAWRRLGPSHGRRTKGM